MSIRSLYICDDCHEVFDQPNSFYEIHTELDDMAREYFSCCPNCGSTSFSEADYCEECEEVFPLSELTDGYCQSCWHDFY